MSYINICKNCGKEFEVKLKAQNDHTNDKKFKRCCSKECTSKLRSKQTTIRNKLREKKAPTIYINVCKNCGKEFKVTQKKQNDPNNKKHFKRCCSSECVSELRSHYIKENIKNGVFDHYHKRMKQDLLKKTEERVGMNLEEALNLYINHNMSMNEIERTHGFPKTKISEELQNRGIEKDNYYRQNQLKIDKAVEEYLNSKKTLTALEKEFGVTRLTLSKYLKSRGIKIRDPLKKYHYNENYFEQIDTEEKAYWLGFLAADGCINEQSTYKSLELTLAEVDRDHLEKFIKSIEGESAMIKSKKSILNDNIFYSNRVTVNCTKMANDLIDKGITPRKSFTLEFPHWLSKELLTPFMRGYFDGDGGVYQRKSAFTINVVGNKHFINDYAKVIQRELNIKIPRVYKKGSSDCIQIYYYGLNASRILAFFYENAEIYLSRKREKFITDKVR
ncbi:LAGLIDADG family homing endonuclease [Bacillus sp. CBEL-1]|uniref:LAGLIDADG family homing endonuclease n=1 Tax=Bacillus sp. CBEL-1 TaxID=2502980 RepID=UPI00104B2C99|nr:LAGLIDADG family homing endonuclease [Bacillus sp. CBEL-1]TDB49568.1 hypothetical protein EPL02_10675 [Bacillus sp. CBEL-1]